MNSGSPGAARNLLGQSTPERDSWVSDNGGLLYWPWELLGCTQFTFSVFPLQVYRVKLGYV